jgi:hypothetical protein
LISVVATISVPSLFVALGAVSSRIPSLAPISIMGAIISPDYSCSKDKTKQQQKCQTKILKFFVKGMIAHLAKVISLLDFIISYRQG